MTVMTEPDLLSDAGFEPPRPRSRAERLLEKWRRIELPAGLILVAGGFVAVALGWYDASGTADVRRQMQALISGGFGGLAAVVLGASLVQAHVTSTSFGQLSGKFERVADALLDLAQSREISDGSVGTRTRGVAGTPPGAAHVIASHASFHAPGCDLTAGREELRELTVEQAQREDLRMCRVCLPSEADPG